MDEPPRVISRRDLLRGVGLAGAVAVTAPAHMVTPASAAPTAAPAAQTATATRVVYENLTAVEGDLVEAIVDRLIPSDALGPGARETGVVRYIDRALGGALASSRSAYGAGLAAIDRYARSSRGAGFLELSATDKDSLLMDVESGSVGPGFFTGNSAQFFAMLLGHTRQGMFGDPFYGGNVDFAGWDLLRYPGVRTVVTEADQRALEANSLRANHRSAYETAMFNKATVRHEEHHAPESVTVRADEREMTHGH
jgi:gluconate 2-dehydrogenase gamma chain